MLKIITADQRLAEIRGPKILIAGPPGVGKTSLLRTVDPATTLFVDLEAGDLAVQDVRVDQVRARTWEECRDLACFLGGPNAAKRATDAYSQQHYDHVVSAYGEGVQLSKYATYFVDSITVAGRLCMAWAQQQPEAFNAKGDPDPRAMYGLLAREMVAWLTQLQHARTKAVVLVCILEAVKDDFGRVQWGLQIDGSKAGRELPGIVDQVIGMAMVTFGDAPEKHRAFLCTPEADDLPGFMAKDRSGRLETYEEPHLGKLLTKLTARPAAMRIASKEA